MDVLVERCAGLDVHKDTVMACLRVPGGGGERHQEVHQFGTTTRELLALRDWLGAHGVTVVGVESTGVYWKPVYYVLEDAFDCQLLNARHLRNVPGRKTDVKDAEWIAQLVEHGLVRPSFVPPKPIRELRNLTRYRKAQIEERTPGGPAAGQDPPGRRGQAVLGGLRPPGGLGEGHAQGPGGGDHRPRRPGRSGPGAALEEDPGPEGGPGGSVRPPPRPHRGDHPVQAGVPGGGHRPPLRRDRGGDRPFRAPGGPA
jgi:Transposase